MKLTIVEKNLLSWTAMHIDFVMCKKVKQRLREGITFLRFFCLCKMFAAKNRSDKTKMYPPGLEFQPIIFRLLPHFYWCPQSPMLVLPSEVNQYKDQPSVKTTKEWWKHELIVLKERTSVHTRSIPLETSVHRNFFVLTFKTAKVNKCESTLHSNI